MSLVETEGTNTPMRHDGEQDQPDPGEVQPTDNSSGVPVDLERLEDVQDEPAETQSKLQ